MRNLYQLREDQLAQGPKRHEQKAMPIEGPFCLLDFTLRLETIRLE
ncbi:MAG: hypothetical protein ACJASV_000603 [Pseudorhodobacter sp.]|jgi:hypothetical protein